MGKVLYHITMSLDGFVAGPGGDMSWMSGWGDDDEPLVDELLGQIGALLIGHRTFRGDGESPAAGEDEGLPYGGMWRGPMFVLAHDAATLHADGYTFVGDLGSGLAAAKKAAGEKYVVILGPNTAKQCLEAGQLDEILVHIVPVMLGSGVRFFEREMGDQVRLERLRLSNSKHITSMWLGVGEVSTSRQ
jgi:dihydrofolate reductase